MFFFLLLSLQLIFFIVYDSTFFIILIFVLFLMRLINLNLGELFSGSICGGVVSKNTSLSKAGWDYAGNLKFSTLVNTHMSL